MLKLTITAILTLLTLSSWANSLLPNDLLQGKSVEITANPKELHTCVMAAIKGIDGVAIDEASYDAKIESVPLRTSMAKVFGVVQRRTSGKVSIFIGVASKHDEPEVQAFAALRVKAIAAGISKVCSNG